MLAAAVVVWTAPVRGMIRAHEEQPLRQATQWLADNVPRNKVLVVHDAIWTDLVHRYGFSPRPIMVYKLDHDPQVRHDLKRVDYLVVPEKYYDQPDPDAYPTLIRARDHAVAVASFGTGETAVHIYRVSIFWNP